MAENDYVFDGEKNDRVPAPAEKCHVCGQLLRHDFNSMKEQCLNESCQVFEIQFNIMHLPRGET